MKENDYKKALQELIEATEAALDNGTILSGGFRRELDQAKNAIDLTEQDVSYPAGRATGHIIN